MATTINTYYDRVKLLQANTLAALETAVNAYIKGDDSGLEEGEHVTDIDINITSDPNAPWQPIYVATLSIVGSTTTV